MSFIENNLQVGEEIKYEAHLHELYLVVGGILLFLGILGLLSVFTNEVLLFLFEPLLGLGCVILGLIAIQAKEKAELVVTNQRVILNAFGYDNLVGFFRRKFYVLDLDKCDSILVTQSSMGERLGYGGIVIGSGGNTIAITCIDNPYKFRDEINKQIENLSNNSKVNISVNNTNSKQVIGSSPNNMVTETKRCPYCGEEININAKKCKHCKEWRD